MAKSKLARGDGHLSSDTPIALTEIPRCAWRIPVIVATP